MLLAQLGQTTHIYDDWAPTLAGAYRVLGLTRRGYGQSTAPATGFFMERLASDIVAALDAEGLGAPVLVGNGFAGEEMTWIGTHLPDRVGGLVYLNAAYDRTNIAAESAIARQVPPQPPGPQDFANAQAITRWSSERLGVPMPESEMRQLARFADDGRVVGQRTPVSVQQQIVASIVRSDYSRVRVPAMSIYTRPTSVNSLPGCRTATDSLVRQGLRGVRRPTIGQLGASCGFARRARDRTALAG